MTCAEEVSRESNFSITKLIVFWFSRKSFSKTPDRPVTPDILSSSSSSIRVSTPKILAKIWVRLLGKNPGLINELQLVTPGMLVRILKNQPVSIISLGEKLFAKKINLLEYSDLDATGVAKQILSIFKKWHLLPIISTTIRLLHTQTPIVLIAQKQQR